MIAFTIAIPAKEQPEVLSAPSNFDLAVRIDIRHCPYCDRPFQAKGTTHRFDRATCRKAWSRKFKGIEV